MIQMTIMWNNKITDFPSIAKKFEDAAQMMEKTEVKTRKGVALAGKRFAQRIAPFKSGKLKAGISYINYKKSTVLFSKAENPINKFPYNFWVNEDIKTVMLLGKPRTYRSTKYTGMPGFFNLTFDMLSKTFPEVLNSELGKGFRQVLR